MEELEMSEQSLDLCNNLPSYPDNWPLPPTPFAISSEGLKEQDAAPRSRSGVFTPPPQGVQPTTAQPTPPMSASSRVLRSSSNASAKSPHRKRLSLSFPIAPSTYASPHTPTTPTDYAAPSPNGSMAFLTALAAQERRVLELREELAKAETELAKLKRQWSIHEATKQRHELLQTEIILGATGDVVEGIKSPTIEEHEARRRAALAKLTQASTRSVTSQRHHRTLSLLSPQRAPNPQPLDLQVNAEPVRVPTPVRRSDTLPTQPTRPLSMTETSSSSVRAALGIKRNSQDMIMQTGKQMAEGFKEGLWAFVEDLRQATVGEDMPPRPPMSRSNSSLGAPGVRRQGSKASLRSVSSSGGSRRGREKSPVKTDLVPDPQRTSHDETPSGRWSTASSVFSETSSIVSVSHSRSSTPRTSTSSDQSSGFIGAPAGVVGGLGVLMSVGTQFSLKKAAGVVVRGLETALEGALVLDEHEERMSWVGEESFYLTYYVMSFFCHGVD
ncbi:hypothetical protein L211DRAFT_600068 [Terfezia boudieri ATCC MYA-4762]|uniref:DUF4048 domain-containing protein n=1 Tax=Terfezia boudieri ATCC MYA-4762 TaxID=1051890 RepID=A0A3N4LVR1_9PEZI|nr:hypothetical protein L211DRAFT_600068 [Terfezia boudieri ATCC MYA-4762]